MYNTEWFIGRIKEERKQDYNEYALQSEYKNAHTKVTFTHLACGNTFDITPNAFLSGQGCRPCGIIRRANSHRLSIDEINKRLPKGTHVVGKYEIESKKTTLHCDICENTYEARIPDITKKKHCSFCNGTNRETTATFSNYLFNCENGDYVLIGEYTSANCHVKLKHTICNTEYLVTPHNFKHGRRCPYCNTSIGEQLVMVSLNELGYSYECQKTFNNLADSHKLSYDFFLNDINLLIEYQGEQHYKPIAHFGGVNKFMTQVKHDNLKRSYANDNGYYLLEISYKVRDKSSIKNIIKEFIEMLGN